MIVLKIAAMVVLAGALAVAATAKIAQPRRAAQSLATGLGLQRRLSITLAIAGALAEEAVATSLVLWPDAPETQAGCIALFGLFAALGIWALESGREIECGCFGALRQSTLGWPQVLQLAIVAPGVVLVPRYTPAISTEAAVSLLFLIHLLAAGVPLMRLSRSWWRIRRDRISLGGVQAHLAGQVS